MDSDRSESEIIQALGAEAHSKSNDVLLARTSEATSRLGSALDGERR